MRSHTPQKGGASIAHYPTEAQIILVDLETDAGKQFVNDWGFESGKVVLDWQWARQCIDRGRALLVDDDWGGFCVNIDQHDDTLRAQVDLKKSVSELSFSCPKVKLEKKPPTYPQAHTSRSRTVRTNCVTNHSNWPRNRGCPAELTRGSSANFVTILSSAFKRGSFTHPESRQCIKSAISSGAI